MFCVMFFYWLILYSLFLLAAEQTVLVQVLNSSDVFSVFSGFS